MQLMKMMFTNGLVVCALSFGLTVSVSVSVSVSATAASSLEHIEFHVQQGDAIHQTYLGTLYRNGEGVRQDYANAFKWFKESSDQGNDSGQFSLAMLYYEGKGVRQDHTKSLELMRKSANQNYTFAQLHMGLMYETGTAVRQNKAIAKEWYGKACDKPQYRQHHLTETGSMPQHSMLYK